MNMRNIFTLMALAAMTAGEKDVYRQRGYNRPERKLPKQKPMTPERERAIMEKIENEKHDFNINGVLICARNRKTALKIYSRMKGGKK